MAFLPRRLSVETIMEDTTSAAFPIVGSPTMGQTTAGLEDEFLPMRWACMPTSPSDEVLSAEKTLRQSRTLNDDTLSGEKIILHRSRILSASPHVGASSPYLPHGDIATGSPVFSSSPPMELTSESPKDSPSGGFERSAFTLSCIKQELEGAAGASKRSSLNFSDSFKMRTQNLTIDVESAREGWRSQAGSGILRRGSFICSPHDCEISSVTPNFNGADGETRPPSWANHNTDTSAGVRPPSARARSPSGCDGSSPSLNPFGAVTRKGSSEPVRPYAVTIDTGADSDDSFLKTPALMDTCEWLVATDGQDPDADMEMCGTPVGPRDGTDTWDARGPPVGVPRGRGPSKFQRSASLFSKKDYTELLLGRSSSDLKFDNHYRCLQLEGRGDFGEVWLAEHHATGKYYALKRSTQTFRGTRDRATFLREIGAMHQIMQTSGFHPNIVRYERAWQDSGYFYIVMEYCDEGTLRGYFDYNAQHNETIDLPTIRHISQGLITGLYYIHAANFLHLDLKPDNLFLSRDHGIKIGDFGLVVENGQWEDEEGDRRYLAPELLQGSADFKADIFSAGLIVYQMLMGLQDLPGNGPDWHRLREPVPNQMVVPATSHDHAEIAQVVTCMIHPDPTCRPSAADMISCEEQQQQQMLQQQIQQWQWHQ